MIPHLRNSTMHFYCFLVTHLKITLITHLKNSTYVFFSHIKSIYLEYVTKFPRLDDYLNCLAKRELTHELFDKIILYKSTFDEHLRKYEIILFCYFVAI